MFWQEKFTKSHLNIYNFMDQEQKTKIVRFSDNSNEPKNSANGRVNHIILKFKSCHSGYQDQVW